MERQGIRSFVFVATAFYFSGCATTPIKPEDLAGKNIAAIQAEDRSVGFARIDDRSLGAPNLGPNPLTHSAELTPGIHKIALAYRSAFNGWQGVPVESDYVFKLNAEAGHVYIAHQDLVRHDSRWAARVWFTDVVSSSTAGEILSSRNEPVTEHVLVFEQSPFFKWAPPQGEDWFVLNRNQGGVVLAKSGKENDETNVISLQVWKLPDLPSLEAFTDHVKIGLQKPGPDPTRFETIECTVEPVQGRKDFCVRYHYVALDKHPRTREDASIGVQAIVHSIGKMIDEPSMTLENYGFACRLGGDKTTAVSLEYSHRSFEDVRNPDMKKNLEKSFAKLEF